MEYLTALNRWTLYNSLKIRHFGLQVGIQFDSLYEKESLHQKHTTQKEE